MARAEVFPMSTRRLSTTALGAAGGMVAGLVYWFAWGCRS